MSSAKKKQDEKNLKILRELAAQPANKLCFDCEQKGPTYINMTIGSFVCTTCSGVLRGLTPPHRVKSITMASFTSEEIEQLRQRGNQRCKETWLGLAGPHSPVRGLTWPPDEASLRSLLVDKYERRRYYLDPGTAPRSAPQDTSDTAAPAPSDDKGKSPNTSEVPATPTAAPQDPAPPKDPPQMGGFANFETANFFTGGTARGPALPTPGLPVLQPAPPTGGGQAPSGLPVLQPTPPSGGGQAPPTRAEGDRYAALKSLDEEFKSGASISGTSPPAPCLVPAAGGTPPTQGLGGSPNPPSLFGGNFFGASPNGASLFGANANTANQNGASVFGASHNGASVFAGSQNGASAFGANQNGANVFGVNQNGANVFGAHQTGVVKAGSLASYSLHGAAAPFGAAPFGAANPFAAPAPHANRNPFAAALTDASNNNSNTNNNNNNNNNNNWASFPPTPPTREEEGVEGGWADFGGTQPPPAGGALTDPWGTPFSGAPVGVGGAGRSHNPFL